MNVTIILDSSPTKQLSRSPSTSFIIAPQSKDRPLNNASKKPLEKAYRLNNNFILWSKKNKCWEYDVSRNPVAEGEFWIKQHIGRPPNTTFPFEGVFYLDQRKLHFDSKHNCWFAQEHNGIAAQWVPDLCFEGEYKQGGTEQLSPTALICWKKENEPETVESLTAPTNSLHVTY